MNLFLFQLAPTNHNTFACITNRFGWVHPNKLMFHGVAREKGRGVPACLFQKEETGKAEKANARWTLKVVHLKNDGSIPGMVTLSLYDSKPFNFISNNCDRIKWKKRTREVWHKGLQRKVEMPLFRVNLIDQYNILHE